MHKPTPSTCHRFSFCACVLLLAASSGSGQTILNDPFTLSTVPPANTYHDPNGNVPARQAGSVTTTYTQGNPTATPGSFGAIEAGSGQLSPNSDALFLRSATAASGLSQFTLDLDSNFGSALSGQKWSLRYDARSASNMTGSMDNWLGIAFGSGASGVDAGGTGSDAFTFAVRENGEWLLWYRDANNVQGFVNNAVPGFVPGQQYSVTVLLDQTLDRPVLTVSVMPLGGSAQTVVDGLQLSAGGADGWFEWRATTLSGGTAGQIFDTRIDNFELTVVP